MQRDFEVEVNNPFVDPSAKKRPTRELIRELHSKRCLWANFKGNFGLKQVFFFIFIKFILHNSSFANRFPPKVHSLLENPRHEMSTRTTILTSKCATEGQINLSYINASLHFTYKRQFIILNVLNAEGEGIYLEMLEVIFFPPPAANALVRLLSNEFKDTIQMLRHLHLDFI